MKSPVEPRWPSAKDLVVAASGGADPPRADRLDEDQAKRGRCGRDCAYIRAGSLSWGEDSLRKMLCMFDGR